MTFPPKSQDWSAKLSNYPEVHEEAQRVWSGDMAFGNLLAIILKIFRVLFRLFCFLLIAFGALADYGLRVCYRAGLTTCERAFWAHRWARRLVSCLHIEATYQGERPNNGILAANHLSYLDIVVLYAQQPLVFVAKTEVRRWPLIGWLTRCAGTIFIDRERKTDVVNAASLFAPVIEDGVVVVLFPEGTSTGGDRVLPFMSSLFEPAATHHWHASAAWIGYSLAEGSVSDDVCYWRNMTFLPHFLKLLSKSSIQAKVVYEPAIPNGLNRKQMARFLHDQVQSLSATRGESAAC